MDIREALLKEHSKRQTMKVVNYIGNDSQRFTKLMKLVLANEDIISQRAAWVMNWSAHFHPALINKWLMPLIKNLQKPNLHDAVKRNTLKILSEIKIPEKCTGICVEQCFAFLRSKDEPVAVKVFAMTVLGNCCMKHPELKTETRWAIKDLLPYGTGGIIARGKIVLRQLEKN